MDLDALLWPRVLWSPLAFGNQGSLYLRYGGLQGLLAGICAGHLWRWWVVHAPNFPGSTTWLCEPPLACLSPCHSCAFHTLSRDLQVWRRGYLVPLASRRSSMFPEGNVPGYVCNPGSPREWDAASQGHTSGIPTRAMLHSWKLAPAAHHVLLNILVMTSPHLTSGRQFWLITHMIQSWTTLMAFP